MLGTLEDKEEEEEEEDEEKGDGMRIQWEEQVCSAVWVMCAVAKHGVPQCGSVITPSDLSSRMCVLCILHFSRFLDHFHPPIFLGPPFSYIFISFPSCQTASNTSHAHEDKDFSSFYIILIWKRVEITDF